MKALERILQIDDEEDILVISKLALTRYGGYTVTSCHDSAQALDVALQTAPDLILLDLMMPGQDGRALARQFAQNIVTRQVPLVFVTATVAPELRHALQSAGAAGVILKPFAPKDLVAQVQAIWQKLAACASA